uniref:F-box domain-containing protein n=1 Tax=Steinernema glaseri TaxID=37863 RepID=A0A1I8ADJ2_9BILA
MDRIPLDLVGRVVNMLLYNDYYKVDFTAMDLRERHVSAFSRLSRPWPQFVTSLQDCHLYVCGNMYSIHTMDNDHPNYHVILWRSEVDILTWNRSRHVVAGVSFGGRPYCECYPTCSRPLSPVVFRKLRNILRRNQRPISTVYCSGDPEELEANMDQLLPSIHGIGQLEVASNLKNYVPRLLEIPVNYFDLSRFYKKDASLVDHMVEAMKKGLLRGWQSRYTTFAPYYDQEKMLSSVMDLHSVHPPKYFWYDRSKLSSDI